MVEKVYLVTEPNDDASAVLRVFLDREEARRYAEPHGADIEEWPIGVPAGLHAAHVLYIWNDFNPAGIPSERPRESWRMEDVPDGPELFEMELHLFPPYRDVRNPSFCLKAKGENHDHVRKAFAERWLELMNNQDKVLEAALQGRKTWP